MTSAPQVNAATTGSDLALAGDWTLVNAHDLEAAGSALLQTPRQEAPVTFDLSGIGRLDTAGAWSINRAQAALAADGAPVKLVGVSPEHEALLKAAAYRAAEPPPSQPVFGVELLDEIGRSASKAGGDLVDAFAFLGRLTTTALSLVRHPRRWRATSTAYHLEKYAIRSAPIIILINLLVGAIIAQQGIFQLSRFGAPQFVVDLIGVLVLRELGVLLTSIMIAGRVGSAITAEIGAMKMREEIDALAVMALDPIETLALPRIGALVVALPLLTFIADIAALAGGMFVASVYGDVTPEVFLSRLQGAIGINTFLVGLIKAPVMALVIGIIATTEGFSVGGSAESLGLKVTESVVKSIFMTIVVDGIFAMLFAAVRY